MKRMLCLLVALGCLATLPGCSSCFGNSCRRSSFMEFRNTGRGIYHRECGAPCSPCNAAPCGCEPCGNSAPCCESVIDEGTMIRPSSPASEPGTFS